MVEIIIDEKDFVSLHGEELVLEKWAAIVPKDGRFPDGLKYRFHACDLDSGKLILRYDNSDRRNEANAKHHKHVIKSGDEKVKSLNLKPKNKQDIIKLLEKFEKEVLNHVRRM